MAHMMETMAWAGETPWHGLGKEVNIDLTPKQMLKAAGLNWSVSKQPLTYVDAKGEVRPVPGKFALMRETDGKCLSVVGSTYKPVQNDAALDFFRKFTEAGHMTMETAGSLWGGRYVWCLARVGADFSIGKKDEVRPYVLLLSPHVIGKALIAQFTPVRVVCWNTLNMALGSGLKGSKNAFRMPHTAYFDARAKLAAEAALGIATEQSKLFAEQATFLSKKKAPRDLVEEYFGHLLEFDPTKKSDDGKPIREPRGMKLLREALDVGPGASLPGSAGTWWGALNAVTFVMDHGKQGRDLETGLKNSWIGHKSDVKREALTKALEFAK